MTKALDVYLHGNFVGQLVQDQHGQMAFSYDERWLNDPESAPISHSLSLMKEAFDQKQCRSYFAGILPEESKRDMIARNLGISAKNDFAMLERIGGECAGSCDFHPRGRTPEPTSG